MVCRMPVLFQEGHDVIKVRKSHKMTARITWGTTLASVKHLFYSWSSWAVWAIQAWCGALRWGC